MSALVFNGAEHEGAGLAAVRAAMDLGYRVSLRQFAALARAAEATGDDAIYVVLAPEGGAIAVTRYDLPARLKRFVGEQLRAAGFRARRYEDASRYELWVEPGPPPTGRARANPRGGAAAAAGALALATPLDELALAAVASNPARRAPAAVRAAARRGLALYARGHRCCTPVGLRRARQLAAGRAVSDADIKAMHAYFARHAVDRRPGWDKRVTRGYLAWLMWGGDAGRAWAARERARLGARRRTR